MKKILISCLTFLLLCIAVNSYGLSTAIQAVCAANAVSCTATYGNELAVTENATDCQDNDCTPAAEADATTGWTDAGAALDSVNTAANTGTYHLSAVSDTAGDYFYRALSLSAGTLYKVSVYIRHNGTASANGEWKCGISSSASATGYDLPIIPYGDNVIKTETTYAEYTKYFYFSTRSDTINFAEANAANDGGIYVDTLSIKVPTLCYGSEVHTDGNASSTTNEANSVGSFTSTGTATFESSSTLPDDGTYSLHMVANGADGRFYIATSGLMTEGHKYLIKFKVKYSAGDTFRCTFATSDTLGTRTEFQSFTSAESAWTQGGWSIVYSATTHAYFGCMEAGGSNNSDFYFDTFSIKEITGE